jgi:hypothetical protein
MGRVPGREISLARNWRSEGIQRLAALRVMAEKIHLRVWMSVQQLRKITRPDRLPNHCTVKVIGIACTTYGDKLYPMT